MRLICYENGAGMFSGKFGTGASLSLILPTPQPVRTGWPSATAARGMNRAMGVN
jgi:hypothetical protein